MASCPALCLLTETINLLNCSEATSGKSESHSHSTSLAKTGVVLILHPFLRGGTLATFYHREPIDTELRIPHPPQPFFSNPYAMAPEWLLTIESTCLDAVQSILLSSRKPCICKTPGKVFILGAIFHLPKPKKFCFARCWAAYWN